jgi:RNA polymerase sigma-70 factor, ECF subfamily
LPWLLAIARNVIRNASRSGRRRDRLMALVAAERAASDLHCSTGRAEDSATDATAAQAVHAALARLSERDREILLLTSWDGLDPGRAAAALGCSRGTVAVRLHRARTRFQRALNAPSPSNPSTFEEPR